MREHAKLQGLLDEALDLAHQVRRGNHVLYSPLLQVAEWIDEFVHQLFTLESELLTPALLEADAWGEVRVERMRRTHRRLRNALESTLEEVREQRLPPHRLAEEIADLVTELEEGMRLEERLLLHPDVLRDDPIVIRQTGG